MGTPGKPTVNTRDPRKQKAAEVTEEEGPPAKKSRNSAAGDVTANDNNAAFSTPTRQSRRIAQMTPGSDEARKKLKKS